MAVLAVYDCETTGIYPETGDDIVQFAALICREGSDELFKTESLADPGFPIPPAAEAVHGISDEMVRTAPAAFLVVREWWDDLLQFAEGEDIVLCGHNTSFDRRFVSKHVDMCDAPEICTMRLAHRWETHADSFKLERLYRGHKGLSSDLTVRAHDAMTDVWMCWELLQQWQSERRFESYSELFKYLSRPVSLPYMPWGKHKGLEFKNVPSKYLHWLHGEPGMDPDVAYSASIALAMGV